MERPLSLLLDTNILIDVLRGERTALVWLEQQQRPAISVISWIEVLVGVVPAIHSNSGHGCTIFLAPTKSYHHQRKGALWASATA